MSRESYDELTIFQAAPLVYYGGDGDFHPLKFLDFDAERKLLTKYLEETDRNNVQIKLDFQVATTERLGDFLASGTSQVIHFSCHGEEQYLALEDRNGCADIVTPNDLKLLFDAGQKKLKLVVVAACHSESTGQAFIDAGIPHVLCCEKDRNSMTKQRRNLAATSTNALQVAEHCPTPLSWPKELCALIAQ